VESISAKGLVSFKLNRNGGLPCANDLTELAEGVLSTRLKTWKQYDCRRVDNLTYEVLFQPGNNNNLVEVEQGGLFEDLEADEDREAGENLATNGTPQEFQKEDISVRWWSS